MLTETTTLILISILAFLVGCLLSATHFKRKIFKPNDVEAELVIAKTEGESPQIFFRGTEEVFEKKSGDHIYVEVICIDK